ncbi:MAG TPA: LemA family protein [Planctomycetota bacterium]|nr:LemA family protein [Planctomycetota bacterium]
MNGTISPLLFFGTAAGLSVVWLLIAVNGVKQLASNCDEAWADVVHDLARRHELVPRLVETARPVLSEHAELLDGTLRASQEAASHRSASPGDLGLDESAVSVTLQKLLGLVEQRPAVKSDAAYQRLRKELVDVEEHLQACRRAYNKVAKELNRKGGAFPVSLLAGREATARREAFELLPMGLPAPAANGRG